MATSKNPWLVQFEFSPAYHKLAIYYGERDTFGPFDHLTAKRLAARVNELLQGEGEPAVARAHSLSKRVRSTEAILRRLRRDYIKSKRQRPEPTQSNNKEDRQQR